MIHLLHYISLSCNFVDLLLLARIQGVIFVSHCDALRADLLDVGWLWDLQDVKNKVYLSTIVIQFYLSSSWSI